MKFIYSDNSLITKDDIAENANILSSYIEHLNVVAKANNYNADEASINLPFDEELIKNVQELAKKKSSSNLKYIFVIGIGGSNLGTKAIYDAFYGYYDNLQPNTFPKMIFLDTQDEQVLTKASKLIESLESPDEILINSISKSGGTTETAANLEIIYDVLTNKFGEIKDRIIITTDKGSKMQQSAEQNGIDFLNLPDKVGGRYSVFSAVGLFPLAVAGFDLNLLRKGAQNMRDLCLKGLQEENPALISALILFLSNKIGKSINDNFIFLPQLESLGKWYRQLMGESIGKDGKGITPTVSIGSTDLHSVGQLYLGGTPDKITTFIYGKAKENNLSVPEKTAFNLVDAIKGKKINDIMQAIVGGTKAAYKKQSLPYTEIVFDSINEETLGSFMQFKMMEMMYLGKLMEINTFNQPHVELYKVETKKILGE